MIIVSFVFIISIAIVQFAIMIVLMRFCFALLQNQLNIEAIPTQQSRKIKPITTTPSDMNLTNVPSQPLGMNGKI